MSHADTMGGHAGVMEKPAFSVPAKKMAMWLFIIADTATFAGCLVAYGFILIRPAMVFRSAIARAALPPASRCSDRQVRHARNSLG